MSMNNIPNPQLYIGVVEDRMDPLKLGRVRVRILGMHTWDKTILKTEDLPWAYKIQPTTSAAISGIGHAPVGVVEGTWVTVQYIDPDQQHPYVTGTLGGIPDNIGFIENFNITDGGSSSTAPSPTQPNPGNPSTTDPNEGTVEEPEPETTEPPATEPPPSDPDWKKKVIARLGVLESTNNYKAVNQLNYIGKYQFGAMALIDRGYVKPGTTNRGLDNPSNWTGKNGVTSKEDFLNNPGVQEQVMSDQVDANYKTMKRIGIPLDSMNDAEKGGYVATAHLLGPGGAKQYYNGVIKSDANGVTAAKYYQEGYKAVTGETPVNTNFAGTNQTNTPANVDKQAKSIQSNTTPAQDAQNQQIALNWAAQFGFYEELFEFTNRRVGFKDPNNKYPLKSHLKEPDTNRLARHEDIAKTIVPMKEATRHLGVMKANGKGSWNQSPVPYNAQYPFNNVWQSESGHVMEFDDTPGKERVHLYHTKGTYTEIDHNGTQVNFIVGDNYVIMERNGYVHVVGNLHVKVDGAHTLKINNTLDIQVNGDATINVHSNANVNVANNLKVTAGGNMYFKANGRIAFDGSRIDLNSGVASGLRPVNSIGGSISEALPLFVNTRSAEITASYEISEDSNDVKISARSTVLAETAVQTPDQIEEPMPSSVNDAQGGDTTSGNIKTDIDAAEDTGYSPEINNAVPSEPIPVVIPGTETPDGFVPNTPIPNELAELAAMYPQVPSGQYVLDTFEITTDDLQYIPGQNGRIV